MAQIKPFHALRPQPEIAKQLASRPYDVMNSEEARKEAKDNPVSFLHVTKSEIDLPENIDPHDKTVYSKANLIHEGRSWMLEIYRQWRSFKY